MCGAQRLATAFSHHLALAFSHHLALLSLRPRPNNSYNDACRVLAPHTEYSLKTTSNKYSSYTRASPHPVPPSTKHGALAYGLAGSITSVPKGFEIETMMAVGAGPNSAVRRWGKLLTTRCAS
jgi:hypothetical protein